MRKNSTDKLLTWNFGRMCVANFLLFASVYLILPFLSYGFRSCGVEPAQASYLYAAFAAGMLAIGPFHAYLGDTYKRKSVLVGSLVLMGVATVGYTVADSWVQLLALAALHGIGFGGATAASITVGIDITPSTRRGEGNKFFALWGRLGMLSGVIAGIYLSSDYDFRWMSYVSVGMLFASVYFSSRVYVAFRAPIGMPVCSMDRFLLPRAWFPALNVLLLSAVPGLFWALRNTGTVGVLPVLCSFAVLTVLCVPFTHLFVQLSHHCQRGTANLTCQLAIEIGILAGLLYAPHSELGVDVTCFIAILSILSFLLLALPYCRHMKVR